MHLVCPQCSATNRVPEERLHQSPLCGQCGHELMAADVVAISDHMLPKFIARTELPILIDFWAEWCGPCRAMAPQFAQAAQAEPLIRFVKVNSDTLPQASQQYGIRSIPTLLLMRGGKEIGRHSGAISAQQLLTWARSLLK